MQGHSTPAYAPAQLAGAVHQLDGVAVDGRVPAGLAVSTVTPNSGPIRYLAVDPGDDDEPTFEPRLEGNDDDVVLSFDDRSVEGRGLVDTALRGSWASLADFGGNLGALQVWAPELMRERLVRRPRERERFTSPFGDAVGTSAVFEIDGPTLTVRHAIAASVDAALTDGETGRVRDAQLEFARASANIGRNMDIRETEVFSATSDGSIFALTLNG